MVSPDAPGSKRYRWGVASRVLAATLGVYATVSLVTAAWTLALLRSGSARPDAVLGATLGSFACYAGLVLYVFCARNAGRAWQLLAVLCLLSSGGAALLARLP